MWNSVPDYLRCGDLSLKTFKRQLKGTGHYTLLMMLIFSSFQHLISALPHHYYDLNEIWNVGWPHGCVWKFQNDGRKVSDVW